MPSSDTPVHHVDLAPPRIFTPLSPPPVGDLTPIGAAPRRYMNNEAVTLAPPGAHQLPRSALLEDLDLHGNVTFVRLFAGDRD